ncbi:MAG TPA: FtsW/RodA/SpoVE family cell cycle protein, partial [Acidimicrobiales bacterium]|nr:FtsW/RodA/SpoVE family cell cycle protein [Acidimicrobiales bacterium]
QGAGRLPGGGAPVTTELPVPLAGPVGTRLRGQRLATLRRGNLRRVGWGPKPRRRSELGLLIVGAVVVLAAEILASFGVQSRTGSGALSLPDHLAELALGVAAFGVAVNFVNRRLAPDADPVMLPIVLVLNGLGFVMIQRIGSADSRPSAQLEWSVLGVAAYALTLLVVRRTRDLERYRYLLAVLAFLLLVSPLLPKVGESINGARLWLHIGSTIEFQPVEIAKILLVIFFASYFVEKRELLTVPTRRIGDRLIPDLRAFGPVAVAGLAAWLIILAEHDIGFSLILFVVFLVLIWVATGRWSYVLLGLVAFVAATYLASRLLGQVNGRIAVWLDPWKYYWDTGYYAGQQPVQGELAFARGGVWGSGLGLGLGAALPGAASTPIPVPSSDFIFAIFGEEIGLIGTSAMVVGYLLVIGAGLRAATRARSEFARLLAVGLTCTLGFQTFFIMAGVLRLLPLTGVTLPFVSYGGSSLVANYVLMALLMRTSDESNGATAVLPATAMVPVSAAAPARPG